MTKILTIDDDPNVRKLFGVYLRSRGHEVVAASDGASGVALCASEQPDAVLCDLRMPGMSGHEVLAQLVRDFPNLPVVIVSGAADLDDAIKALKLGAWDYITKPILDHGVIDHALRRVLERSRLISENDAYRAHLEVANEKLDRSLRQLEDDEASGREIQWSLLPPSPAFFDSYECSRYLATSAIMGGDFVDYFAIDGGRFGFYIADVSGHGVASAVITVMLKSRMDRLLENFLRYGDPTIVDPAALLARLNRDFRGSPRGKYVTMFYGVIDPHARRLDFANGGHFPFPFLCDGAEVREIGGKSRPVGLFEDAVYATSSIEVPDQFALRLYSDGVLELLPAEDLAGRKELLRSASHNVDLDAEGLARKLGLDEHTASPDDVTVLSIRKR